jgi:hypothetical protein
MEVLLRRSFLVLLLGACDEAVVPTPGPGSGQTSITEDAGSVFIGRATVSVTGSGLPSEVDGLDLRDDFQLLWTVDDSYELRATGGGAILEVSAVPWRGPGTQGALPVAGAVRAGMLWVQDDPSMRVEVPLGDGRACELTVDVDPRLGSVVCEAGAVRVDDAEGPMGTLSASWGLP